GRARRPHREQCAAVQRQRLCHLERHVNGGTTNGRDSGPGTSGSAESQASRGSSADCRDVSYDPRVGTSPHRRGCSGWLACPPPMTWGIVGSHQDVEGLPISALVAYLLLGCGAASPPRTPAMGSQG